MKNVLHKLYVHFDVIILRLCSGHALTLIAVNANLEFFNKTHVVGTQKNLLNETIPLSTRDI